MKFLTEMHNSGSSDHLVGITAKRQRLWRKLINGRTSTEKKLFAAVILLGCLGLALSIALIAVATRRQRRLCYSSECIRTAATLLDSMDTRVNPCEDFFAFTCGRWSEAHLTNKETNSWFADRTRYLSVKMASILSENASNNDPLPLVYAKSLYSSCMDTAKLDAQGTTPMLDVLEKVSLPRQLPDDKTAASFRLSTVLAKVQRALSMDIFIQLSMTVDPATNRTAFVVAPAFGVSSLPELVKSEEHVAATAKEAITIRLAYMTSIMSVLQPAANSSDLGAAALKILMIDSRVRSDIQKSDLEQPASKMTFGELQQMMDDVNATSTPKIRMDWQDYLDNLMTGLGKKVTLNDTVFVDGKDYFVMLAERLHSAQPVSYQRYVWWSLVTAMVPHSSNELRSLKDDLYEALFRRPKSPRSSKCVKYVRSFFNMAIAYKFEALDNLVETSRKVEMMLEDITHSFSALVDSLPWMDRSTKLNATRKARAIKSYIGYPKWLSKPGEIEQLYEGIEVIDGQFLQSMIGIKSVEVKEILKAVGELPPNQTKGWVTDPLEVNAFYARGTNAIGNVSYSVSMPPLVSVHSIFSKITVLLTKKIIVQAAIPAGILQSPFYFLGLEALNYGAIGTILGHELTHAFDIEGKDFDANGKKVAWWDQKMTKEYDVRAQCFVKQYDKFSFTPENRLNGTLTLAENIADNGGVREAFHAYKYYQERNSEEPLLPGLEQFTHDQLFFLAFANVWCEKSTMEESINSLNDVHSPNRFRVLGTLRNSKVFSEVWNCPVGSKMNPASKCVLW